MSSIWSEQITLPEFPELQEDLRTNVLIIGGGLAGLLCAYYCKQAGIETVLLEADTIAGGVTGNTTAKVTSQHGLRYAKMCDQYGLELTRQYLEANELAIRQYKKLSWHYQFEFEEKDAYLFSTTDEWMLRKEVDVLHRLTYPAEYVTKTELPFEVKAAVRFPEQGQMNPYRLVAEISKELPIYEHSRVKEMTEYFAVTEKGTVTAEKIIIATHFPIIDKKGLYFLKLYQQRSYVLALKGVKALDGIYLETEKNGISMRSVGDTLLLGGGGNRTGKPARGYEYLRNFANMYFPDAAEYANWAAQDCMSLDGIPYIGCYSKSTPDLYVATGFNKWGMTSAMIAAQILTDLVQGYDNEYAKLFSPSRGMFSRQLFTNLKEATVNLLSFGGKRCTHLGCKLRWNALEHTWDCPCHGSRFDEEGNPIKNPASDPLKK